MKLGPKARSLIAVCTALATLAGLVALARAQAAKCKGKTATIVGTPRNDKLDGTPGSDVIVGLGRNDEIHAGGGDDLVCGGPGADWLYGEHGDDELTSAADPRVGPEACG